MTKNTQIAVLDYENHNVLLLKVKKSTIENQYAGDVSAYLADALPDINLDGIAWMLGVKNVRVGLSV